MNHTEFIKKYNLKEISVHIDKNKAGFMYQQPNLMPRNLRTKQALIRALAFGGFIASIALFFFIPWWAALALLFISLSMFPKAQNIAAQGVLEASLQDPNIYQTSVDNQVLRTTEVV